MIRKMFSILCCCIIFMLIIYVHWIKSFFLFYPLVIKQFINAIACERMIDEV